MSFQTLSAAAVLDNILLDLSNALGNALDISTGSEGTFFAAATLSLNGRQIAIWVDQEHDRRKGMVITVCGQDTTSPEVEIRVPNLQTRNDYPAVDATVAFVKNYLSMAEEYFTNPV